MIRSQRPKILLLLLAVIFVPGCFSSRQIIAEKAPALFRDVARSANRQSDVALVRQAIPAYLILIDGMIESYPDRKDLLLAAAQAYSGYAAVLPEDERDRAVDLNKKAKTYALKALNLTPPIGEFAGKPLEVFQERLEKTQKEDVPTLFWVGNVWGTWIAADGGPEAMADLPWGEALMERVLHLDPGYYYGGAYLFQAVLLSARPEQFGGNLKKAKANFEKARSYGGGKFLMADVYYAEYYARQVLDRDLYVSTLKRVLETPPDIEPDLTLANTLAQQKAKNLLSRVDEFF